MLQTPIRWLLLANGLLLLGVIAVIIVLISRLPNRVRSEASQDNRPSSEQVASPSVNGISVHRETVTRQITFQASFGDPVIRRMSPEVLFTHGVQSREWDLLPSSPGMDMSETPHDYVLAVSLPGARPENIYLSITNSVVTILARFCDNRGNMIGSMIRRVQLPVLPNGGHPAVTSCFSNGMLRVCVAK